MTDIKPKPPSIDPELYRRLTSEAKNPFRSFRRFFYFSFAGSAAIGGVVFIAKLAAGRELETTIPNLAIQAGAVALFVWLLRIDSDQPTLRERDREDRS
jgi:Low psii accumulation1 / Rep27